MFFSVASPDWKPGLPLAPAGALLFRSQAEAAAFALEAVVVSVSVRHDASSRMVRPQGPGACSVGTWSSQAVDNVLGGVTVFGLIPASLIRPIAEVDSNLVAAVVPSEFHGWDSLTMALLA